MSVLMKIERSEYLKLKKENELLTIENKNLKKENETLKNKFTAVEETAEKKTKKKGAND